MGHAIVYCFRCNTQLREAQFEQGKAYRIDSWVCCSECAPEAIRSLPPDRVQILLKQIHAQEKPAPAPRPRVPLRDSRPMPAVRPAKSSRVPLFAGLAAGAALMAGLAFLLARGPSPTPAPPAAAAPKPVPKPAPAETPERLALKKANAFASQNPDDLAGQIREFEKVAFMADGSEAAAEARRKVAALRAREKDETDRAMDALERELTTSLKSEAFGNALKTLESAKSRRAGPPWTFAVEKRARELEAQIVRTFEGLRDQAKEAKLADRKADVDAVVSRVKGWGIPRYAEELKETLAAVVTHLELDDCDQISAPWKFVGGEEFPGAKGSLTVDPDVKHGGRGSFRLQADFTGGGAYVGFWRDLKGAMGGRDLKEIRVWIKTRTVLTVGIRLADDSGQVHQKTGGVAVPPSDQWQEIVFRVQDVIGSERWGGANDGKWHGPPVGFGINIGRNSFGTGPLRGELWLDDLRVVLAQP